jgi:ABC-2 type transport system ATP-binding protein
LMTDLQVSTSYDIEVDSNYDRVREILMGIPYLNTVTIANAKAFRDDRLRLLITSEGSHEIGRDISTALVANGIPPYEMRRIQASLEDVFLELTTEETSITQPTVESLDESQLEPSGEEKE